jgi:hypothetical protein
MYLRLCSIWWWFGSSYVSVAEIVYGGGLVPVYTAKEKKEERSSNRIIYNMLWNITIGFVSFLVNGSTE